jgi:N utilization substance protein B
MAVMHLYHLFFEQEEKTSEVDFEDLELGNFSKKIYDQLVEGVTKDYEKLDALVDNYSIPMKAADLDRLILQILRVSLYEGFIAQTIPPKVAVDEAIELTRDFGLEFGTRKVSGILGKIFEETIPKTQTEEKVEKKD